MTHIEKMGKPTMLTPSLMTDVRQDRNIRRITNATLQELHKEKYRDYDHVFTAYAADDPLTDRDARTLIDDYKIDQLLPMQRMALQFATEAYFDDLGFTDSFLMIYRLKMLTLRDDINTLLEERGYVVPNAITSKFTRPVKEDNDETL